MTDVWIDTDPSIGIPFHEADDGFALIQAFHSPELRIRGISTSYGNAGLPATTRLAREITERFGGTAGVASQHVFAGASSARSLGQPTAATAALGAALGERPLTYLALAPLTNLATFLKLHPEQASRLQRVIFIGGRSPGTRLRAGGWNPYEFTDGNFHKDNAAAAVLLASDVPLTLVPVVLALTRLLTPGELVRIGREGGPAGEYLASRAKPWMRLWRLFCGVEGGAIFDCFAVLAATQPHLLAGERRFAGIVHRAPGTRPARPREIHLVAELVPGEAWTREVLFCGSALEGARELILQRLLGRDQAGNANSRTP